MKRKVITINSKELFTAEQRERFLALADQNNLIPDFVAFKFFVSYGLVCETDRLLEIVPLVQSQFKADENFEVSVQDYSHKYDVLNASILE